MVMTPESPGQRCAESCGHAGWGDACAACIDVLVKRERAAVWREAAKECVDNMFSSNATDLVSTIYRTISHRLEARAAEEESA